MSQWIHFFSFDMNGNGWPASFTEMNYIKHKVTNMQLLTYVYDEQVIIESLLQKDTVKRNIPLKTSDKMNNIVF